MEAFIQSGIEFLVSVSDRAAELDGRLAFAMGLVAWFLVEQAIRRFAGIIRRAILVGALAAMGYGLFYIVSLVLESATPPTI